MRYKVILSMNDLVCEVEAKNKDEACELAGYILADTDADELFEGIEKVEEIK